MPVTHGLVQDTDEAFQVRVAWLYHIEGMTQGAVADHLGVTRLRVNRALADATRNGYVRISIHSPYSLCIELEEALRERFNLNVVSIAPETADADHAQQVVAAQLGSYWSKLLAEPGISNFGIAWGNTLHYGVRAVNPVRRRPRLNVVSVMGGLPKGSDVNSFEITARLAELYGATPNYLTAPVYASTQSSRDTIVAQDVFRQSLKTIRRCDAITTSVGDMSPRSLLIRDGLPGDVAVHELIAQGAVGDIMGHFIDAAGRPIAHDINRRVIGIDPWELRRKRNIALASGGPHKIEVILAALRTGIYDAFISDQRTATDLLERLGGES